MREEKIVWTTCFVYVDIFEGKIKRKKRERVSFGNMKLAKKKKKKIRGKRKASTHIIQYMDYCYSLEKELQIR